jgi:hypothetical protein
MSAEPWRDLSPRMEQAIEELKSIILERYPEATFRVVPDPEDAETILLKPTVDVEDRDEVVELVIDRLVDLSIHEGLSILVVPQRTPARNEAIWRAQKQSRSA